MNITTKAPTKHTETFSLHCWCVDLLFLCLRLPEEKNNCHNSIYDCHKTMHCFKLLFTIFMIIIFFYRESLFSFTPVGKMWANAKMGMRITRKCIVIILMVMSTFTLMNLKVNRNGHPNVKQFPFITMIIIIGWVQVEQM